MITDISELNSVPVIIVAYESGSSGEFLCSALSQSFDMFSNLEHSWMTDNRVKFSDFFGKDLSCGKEEISPDILLNRINDYLKLHTQQTKHIGTVHPRPSASIDFINQHAPDLPMIKIVCYDLLSKRFRQQAAGEKLRLGKPIDLNRVELLNEMAWADQYKNPSIKVEWTSLFLHNTKSEFHRIEEFIGQPGNWDIFDSMVRDYMHRNRGILQRSKLD